MPTLEINGQRVEVDDGFSKLSPDQQNATVDEIAKSMQASAAPAPIPSGVDQSGAPAFIRTEVGSAHSPQDRLATLRKFFPDARPVEGNNFVYTDPQTKRPTLYNPEGLDSGDIPSILPELTEVAGGTMGGIIGSAGGPGGTMLGAGLGAATARNAYDALAHIGMQTVDTRTLPQRLGDTAVTGLVNSAGQGAADILGQALRPVGTAIKSKLAGSGAAQRLKDLVANNITPRPGLVSTSPVVQGLDKSLESIPSGMGPTLAARTQTIDEIQNAANDIASQYGRVMSKAGAGDVLRMGAKSAAGRIKDRQSALYDAAFNRVGADTPVAVPAVQALRQSLVDAASQAPESLTPSVSRALQQTDRILADAQNGGVPFKALRQVRTNLRRDLDNPVLLGSTGSQNEALQKVYGALTEDMRSAAQQAGAGHELTIADRYTRFQMNQTAPTLEKIAKMEEPGKVYEWALSGSRDDATRLARIRRSLNADEWDDFSGTVLGRMGLSNPGVQDAAGEAFSPATFLTNWNKLSPQAKNTLFGGTRYAQLRPSLDSLTRTIGSMKEVDRLGNPSGTARGLGWQALLGALGGGWAGGAEGAAAAAGATVVAPYAAAKLITNPRFARWLASAPVASTTATGFKSHLARLAAIGEAEPSIRAEIGQYLQALGQAQAEGDKSRPGASTE